MQDVHTNIQETAVTTLNNVHVYLEKHSKQRQ